ncbi:MAG: hypothetical protein LUB59_06855, partial [Candidatus Gastranaerophilales bacterium]|nr:hypothetical protein [Candidatus Gastranaerophilales bacterium]
NNAVECNTILIVLHSSKALKHNKEKENKKNKGNHSQMGMSSSQARLLHLTARLHSIEHKAQKIEADKLRLANDSERVYDDYLLALDQTKTMAKILQPDGTMTNTELTAAKIFNYNELMEQYALETADGKALVSESLHNTYMNTDSLSDFLNAYGLNSTYTQTVHHVVENEAYTNAMSSYTTVHDAWEAEKEAYDAAYEAYLLDHAAWEEEQAQYLIDHAEWEASEPDADDKTQVWWTTSTDDSLATAFKTAGASCYNSAINGTVSCYAHVLAHIIDFYEGAGYDPDASGYVNSSWYDGTNNAYTTSIGTSITVLKSYITGAGMNSASNDAVMAEVSETINDESTYVATAADGETCDVTESSTDFEKLISKWNVDGTLKSMKQWAIDLYYVCINTGSVSGYDKDTLISTVTIYQAALSNSLTEFSEEVYTEYYTDWEDSEPTLRAEPTFSLTLSAEPQLENYVGSISPTVEYDETVDHATFTDKNLAQWYINLWYKMEGEDEVPQVQEETIYDDATQSWVTIYSVDSKTKSSTTYSTNSDWNTTENENYMVITDQYLNSSEWLHNAIQEGFVVIQVYSDTESAFEDTSVAVDTGLLEVQDETKIKKAEAQYEADMNEINKKDTRYDTQLSKCETEREAIVDELDSLRTVIDDNEERTFKLFS